MGKVKATFQQKKTPAIKNTQSIGKKRNKEKGKNIKNSKKKITHLKNKHATKDTKKLHTSTKYSKDNDKAKKVFQKAGKKSIDTERTERKINNIKKLNKKKLKQIPDETKNTSRSNVQQVESSKILKFNNHRINISRLDQMLTKRQTKKVKQIVPLKDRLMRMLRASRFRFINETLYTNNSSQSNRYFKEDPDAFDAYHDGYKQQVEQWPVNPLDVIISYIKDAVPIDNVVADFGCGEARLASSVPHKVHSFDFIALNDSVTACDMAHTPLLANSVHVVVFCLSLMGTNLNDYITEANRVLKNNGILKVAEVASRFENGNNFVKLLGSFGFKNTWTDFSHDLFYFMDFKKVTDVSMKRKNLPEITLKSCLYKKR